MKKILFALGALLTVAALPAAHADDYRGCDDGRGGYDSQHIQHDRGELHRAYWKRDQDIREYWQARTNGDWDAMQREQWEIAQDNNWIAHEQQAMQHDRWSRWHAQDGDWE